MKKKDKGSVNPDPFPCYLTDRKVDLTFLFRFEDVLFNDPLLLIKVDDHDPFVFALIKIRFCPEIGALIIDNEIILRQPKPFCYFTDGKETEGFRLVNPKTQKLVQGRGENPS